MIKQFCTNSFAPTLKFPFHIFIPAPSEPCTESNYHLTFSMNTIKYNPIYIDWSCSFLVDSVRRELKDVLGARSLKKK